MSTDKSTLAQVPSQVSNHFCTLVLIVMSLSWNSAVVDRCPQRKQNLRMVAELWYDDDKHRRSPENLLRNLSSTTTMRRRCSSSVSISRITSPWWMRDTWHFCWTQSLNLWRTFRRERKEPAVTIRTLSHTLYALLATPDHGTKLETGAKSAEQKMGFEAWRQMAVEKAPKTAGRRFEMLQAVLQPGMSDNPAKFEETSKSWEHQVEIYEKSLLNKGWTMTWRSAWCCENAHRNCEDHLLVNSQQFWE